MGHGGGGMGSPDGEGAMRNEDGEREAMRKAEGT